MRLAKLATALTVLLPAACSPAAPEDTTARRPGLTFERSSTAVRDGDAATGAKQKETSGEAAAPGSGPGKSPGVRPRIAGVSARGGSVPKWNSDYAVEGAVSFTSGGFTREMPVPTSASVNYAERVGALTFYSESRESEDKWYGMGLILHLEDPRGQSIRRLSIIAPDPAGGTVTFGVRSTEPVSWLALETGGTDSSATDAGRYRLTVRRIARTQWQLAVAPEPGATPRPWLTTATFDVTASSANPPWASIDIDFVVTDERSETTGNLRMVKR